MPDALLLSPDDQAVSAITGVLEEMAVTCERPLDGVSAAQKLNSHNFDLVLVDCENLPAAKLIFDVCRRGKNGNNPVPIAIVDGRAGLPTAFRLGAELILTKPVAKDQARTTIRAAVSRLRKDAPNEIIVQTASAGIVIKEPAPAASVAPQLTSFAEPAPSFARGTVPPSYLTAALSASLSTKMHTTMDEVAREREAKSATSKLSPPSAASSEAPSELSSARAKAKPTRPLNPNDDLVLAELNRTELAASEAAESKLESSKLDKAAAKKPAPKPALDVPSFDKHRQWKRRASLVAFLMLLCAGGGFYAAWRYQPGFREIAQPKIDRLLELAGMALPPTPAPNTAKPSAQVAPAKTPEAAAQSPTNLSQTQSTVSGAATGSVTSSTSEAASAPPVVTTAAAVIQPSSKATSPFAPVGSKPEASTINASKTESKKDIAPAPSSATQLPGEDSAIILSSKGAEKRLAHSVPPKYPEDLRSGNAQGTVVLKTVVNENGEVEGVRLVDGNAALAAAAIEAVKQWHYRPYVRDGKAQPFQTIVIIDFQRPSPKTKADGQS